MNTLYDLLGACPDDEAEELTNAFRKAARASRAAAMAGDPDASKRFRQIVEAYDILRDAEQRATYDRLLARGHGTLRSKLMRAASCLMHHSISDALGIVSLVVILAGGHTLFTSISRTPVNSRAPVNAVAVTARDPTQTANVQPAPRIGITEAREHGDTPENSAVRGAPKTIPGDDARAAKQGGTPEAAKAGPASGPAPPAIDVEKTDSAAAASIDQDSIDQEQARPGDVQLPSRKKDSSVAKSALSDFVEPSGERDMKTPETRAADTRNMNTPRVKMTGRKAGDAKRQARNRTPVKQASLESRKTWACSGRQACAGDEPPLFGVGF